MNVVAEVVLDDQGYPYVNWHETGEDFYEHYPVGTKFCVLQSQQEPVAQVVMAAKPPNASLAWLPFKIVHASLEWLDSVPVGTKLYTAQQAQFVQRTRDDAESWDDRYGIGGRYGLVGCYGRAGFTDGDPNDGY